MECPEGVAGFEPRAACADWPLVGGIAECFHAEIERMFLQGARLASIAFQFNVPGFMHAGICRTEPAPPDRVFAHVESPDSSLGGQTEWARLQHCSSLRELHCRPT